MHPPLKRLLALWMGLATCAATPAVQTETHRADAPVAASRTLARIASDGVIRVGYIPTPGTFAFRNAKGETVGYSIDLCLRVIDNVAIAVHRPTLRIEFHPLEAAERIPLLKAGSIDIECGGNTNTLGRQRDVDFSYTFFNTGVRFLARSTDTLDGPASLRRKRIAVNKGTTAEELVARLQTDQEAVPVVVSTDEEGVRLVERGEADCFAQDDILLYGLLAKSPMRSRLAVTGRFLTVEPYAFMLPKDDDGFRDIVDRTLGAMMRSGELGAVYRKWFETPALRVPMSIYMQENVRFPNRYGIPR